MGSIENGWVGANERERTSDLVRDQRIPKSAALLQILSDR